jgi:4-amino-4-deoxy-L-arabinose transferase-like glycosyltransferase
MPTSKVRARLTANKPLILLVALVLALVLADVVWLSADRHGGAMDIDEAGYLSMSVNDYHALRQGGLEGLVRTADAQPTQAPLVPGLTAFVYLVRGRPTFLGAFAVQLLAYVIVILATYSIGSLIANRWVGLVSALATASLPIMVHYIHEYSFAVPAAAAVSVAIWAALRADWMRLRRFTVVWGVALGAMLIARTMTIAFLPAFGLMAVLQVAASPQRKRSLTGVACGLAAAVVVAGPWYLAQGRSVWQYLTSFGYGAASSQYGTRSLLSPASWLVPARGNLNEYVWLPLAVVLAAGGVALMTALVRMLLRRRLPSARTVIGSPWFYLGVVVAEGLLALQSSRNGGSAFPAPILPAMVVLAVAGLARTGVRRRSYVCVALGAVVALCLPSLIATTALNTAAGQPASVDLPGLGPTTVVDARDQYINYASAEGELNLGDLRGVKWRRANDDLMSAVDSVVGAPPRMPVVFAFVHSLVNTNTLQWEELMFQGASPAIYLLSASASGSAGYSAQLYQMLGSGHGVVLLSSDPVGMFPPVLDQMAVRGSLVKLGFALKRTTPLPDGSDVKVWAR